MAILLFFLVLFVLILVHEWGHFIVAKKTGMRVDEFGIGFPPKLFGMKKGETEYTFNALPIGGFVRIFGEDSEAARESGDYERSFVAQSKWAQAAVLFAGVTMNVIFAWFLYIIIFMMGVPSVVDETTATEDARLVITEVLADSPAAAAGLSPGVTITDLVAEDTADMDLTPTSFRSFTETNESLEITFVQGGEVQIAELRPEAGIIDSDTERPAVGVALALVETVQQPIHLAVRDASVTTVETLRAVTVGLSSLIVDSIRGEADFSQVAGPVGIVGLVGDAAEFGFTSLLLFTAVISLNLAVINLLPFPALDGGRLVFVAIEAVTRKPINPVWVMRLNTLGFLLLMLLMVAVTYNDILKLL